MSEQKNMFEHLLS